VSRLAKWATRALISTGSVEALQESLARKFDEFCGHVAELLCPLSSLSQLAKHAPDSYRPIALGVFDFLIALLSGAKNAQVHSCSKIKKSKRARAPCVDASLVIETVRRAVKLLVHSAEFVDDEFHRVVDVLVSIAEGKDGNVFGFAAQNVMYVEGQGKSNAGEQDAALYLANAVCRLSSCVGIVLLARQRRFSSKISPRSFLSAILCCQDEHPDVRLLFARHVHNCILRKRLPFRWVACYALMAVDPDAENSREARTMCSEVIRNRRYLHRLAVQRSERQEVLAQLLPEAALPVVIWVSANHPDVGDDAGRGYDESAKYLDFFLDRLLESTEYAAILHDLLASIALTANDVVPGEESDKHVHELTKAASSLLNRKQAGRIWHVEHTCRPSLPPDLFRSRRRQPAKPDDGAHQASKQSTERYE
jgi:hypothetical protein